MSINIAHTNHEIFWIHLFSANQVYIYTLQDTSTREIQTYSKIIASLFQLDLCTCWNSEIESAGFPQYRKQSLVGGWTNPFEKYGRQNGFIFPNFRGEHKKCLSCHLLGITGWLQFFRWNLVSHNFNHNVWIGHWWLWNAPTGKGVKCTVPS